MFEGKECLVWAPGFDPESPGWAPGALLKLNPHEKVDVRVR